MQWTRADNGRNVNLSEAQVHCAGLGSDRSLPTLAQLRSLYDKRPCLAFDVSVAAARCPTYGLKRRLVLVLGG